MIALKVQKNSIVMNVSREMLLDIGAIEPRPEELAERNAQSEVFHGEQRARRIRTLAALAELRTKNALTVVLLDLHSCDTEADWTVECEGCDFSGYEGEPPGWPCRTVLALAGYYGVDMPDDLPGKHYEGEFKPSDGKAFKLPPMRAFVDLSDD